MAQTNNKRLYVMLGILGILLLYLILNKTVLAKKDKVKSPVVDKTKNISSVVPETVSTNRKMVINKINNLNYVVKEFQFEGNWQSDPFFYLDEDSLRALRERELGQYTNLRLSGISLLRDKGYSLINSVIMTDVDTVMTASILKEGDEFDGFRVIKIAFDYVILRKGSRNIRLELDES
ncbi:MAG: hypothetical protein GWP19_10365 [Planctomycetia bacterium]|nr:hypothetical protein [Planctomycetia bacterium]